MDQELIAKLHDLAKMAEEKGWPGIPVVGGWPMPPDGGVVRLFMALGLGDWVEIPERAILLRAPANKAERYAKEFSRLNVPLLAGAPSGCLRAGCHW